jgi:hypothetical protein
MTAAVDLEGRPLHLFRSRDDFGRVMISIALIDFDRVD